MTATKTIEKLEAGLAKALKDLIGLDYDAVAAYETAAERLESKKYQKVLREFKRDHEHHIKELSAFLKKVDESVPTSAGVKSYLTQGKVILAKLMGDTTILRAVRSNEIDANTAYGRINNYEEIPQEIKNILKQGLKNVKSHLAWLEETLDVV